MSITAPRDAPISAWAPLRIPLYRALLMAQFASNVGTWMQTVGAQWLMGDLTHDPLQVALVQTATSLPVFLFGFPAGALGDVFDRRRVLLVSQAFMLVAAAVLAALTFSGDTTPWVLLGITFVIGAGRALTAPSWQAIQPQLVGRRLIPQAAALGAASVNVARAAGPALGGALVAAAGAAWVFGVNAISFLGVLAVLVAWRRERVEKPLGPEHVRSALRAGSRYVRSSPRMKAILARSALFVLFASALWALLPIVARTDLKLGSGGYGLLLAAVGVGAVAGTALLPRLRQRASLDRIVAGASVAFAAACAVIAWVHVVAVVAVALVVTGFAWIAALSSLNATAQSVLPDWVRSRGMALYIIVFQGGQAVGALVWGVVVKQADTRVAFTAVAIGLLGGAVVARRWHLRAPGAIDVRPAQPYPEPDMVIEPDPGHGPVLVQVVYRVPLERAAAFREAMQPVGRARRRSGGERWGLFQDGADPERFVEAYLVPTWEEHMRQHQERITYTDRLFEERALELVAEGTEPRVEHLLWAHPDLTPQ
jgi:MFS family permease